MKTEIPRSDFLLTEPFKLSSPFIGRQSELRTILSIIQKGKTKLIGIHGMAGAGKTTLALNLVRHLSRGYRYSHYYIDMGVVQQDRRLTAHLVIPIIRSIQPGIVLPQKGDDMIALYRSLLYRKRGILLIDNVEDPQYVLPLLPFSEHPVIIISRRNFTLPNLYSLRVGVLPPLEARQLIITIAPKLRVVADEIAKLCEYLPLALKLAAESYNRYADMNPSSFINQISISMQGMRTNDSNSLLNLEMMETLKASIYRSYKSLNQQLQRFWCILSKLPQYFNIVSAAAIWNLDSDATHLLLSKLVSRNLLEWIPAKSAYHLHPILHSFASAHLKDHT